MSLIKRWLEEVSDDMGHGGEINDEVLAEGNRRMAHMGRAMELKEALVECRPAPAPNVVRERIQEDKENVAKETLGS